MAVKRAILFRAGTRGLTCAAYEVVIERGSQDRKGTIRPVRDCPNPTTEVVKGTGLCDDCAAIYRNAEIQVVSRVVKGGQ
jgi:hypothetical protein